MYDEFFKPTKVVLVRKWNENMIDELDSPKESD